MHLPSLRGPDGLLAISGRLENARQVREHPIMTVKTDDKKRVVLPTAKPGDVFQVELSAGGKILLTRLSPPEPRLVKPRKVNGRWMGNPKARPDRQAIVEAIRADRESR